MIEKVKIDLVKLNPNNPRIIQDDKFKKLVKSIQEFPEMLDIRPIVVDNDMVVLGGNMRLKASIKAGLEEVSIIKVDSLTEEQKKEFIVKDNASFGDWDWEILQAEWDMDLLSDWGIDVVEWGNTDMLDVVNKGDENDEWVGMPEFDIPDKKPRLIVTFETKDEMEEFCKLKTIKPSKKGGTVWNYNWPENNTTGDDMTSIKIN